MRTLLAALAVCLASAPAAAGERWDEIFADPLEAVRASSDLPVVHGDLMNSLYLEWKPGEMHRQMSVVAKQYAAAVSALDEYQREDEVLVRTMSTELILAANYVQLGRCEPKCWYDGLAFASATVDGRKVTSNFTKWLDGGMHKICFATVTVTAEDRRLLSSSVSLRCEREHD